MEVVITSLCHRTPHYGNVWGSKSVTAYDFITQAPDGDEWAASLPGCSNSRAKLLAIIV
jgi:hypothetical protein